MDSIKTAGLIIHFSLLASCGQYLGENDLALNDSDSESTKQSGRKPDYYVQNLGQNNEDENLDASLEDDEALSADNEESNLEESEGADRSVAAVAAPVALASPAAVTKPAAMSSFVYAINSAAKWSGTPQVVFVDLFDTTAAKVSAYKKNKQMVICYFSAGTRESWRPDKNKFPAKAVGKKMEDWEGEYWIDFRDASIRNVMKARLEMAKSKGCQGVDPDNVDGHLNSTGFPLKGSDQKSYLSYLSTEAHARGMSMGLKNSAETATSLVSVSDFVVVEECHAYKECASYSAFSKAGKAIFQIEYRSKSTSLCNAAKSQKANLVFSDYDLKKFSFCN